MKNNAENKALEKQAGSEPVDTERHSAGVTPGHPRLVAAGEFYRDL